ncbi:MAG: hypothetical protein COT74_10680 [Bdellovibrionales bacterium CG10_big_fil_rev_8_21_14_0_10_45_34]|nr:MAG: hypothetical protein COT74_10680 [Bdellovibrionales bacterium CG10_big_fil_rev_8_21_14_0_10_45_34]
MDLKSIQKEIFQIVRTTGNSDSDLVVSDEKLKASERLHTYKRSSYLKPHSCLSDDFQVTKSLLGEERFDKLVESYLTLYPADTHFINECGKYFPDFLAASNEASSYPFIKDLSHLEWLRVESFYDFFNYKDENKNLGKVVVNPSIKTLLSDWPLHLIWDEEKAHGKKLTKVFVWTTEDRSVHVQAWSDDETKILTEMLRSSSLDSAVEILLLDFESEKLTEILTKNLSAWINAGLFEIKAET